MQRPAVATETFAAFVGIDWADTKHDPRARPMDAAYVDCVLGGPRPASAAARRP